MHRLVLAFAALLAVLPAQASEAPSAPFGVATDDLNPVELWLYHAALQQAPPERAWTPPSGPHADETPQARARRYKTIAKDIYRVVFDSRAKPIPGFNRLDTAGFVLGHAIGESALSPDADLGPCYREHPWQTRCDGGQSVGILQLQIEKSQQPEFFGNRKRLIWHALKALRSSFSACRDLPVEERLAMYGAGNCESERGRVASRKRWPLIQSVMYSAPHLRPSSSSNYVIDAPL